MTDRQKKLLKAAALTFRLQNNPFEDDFLISHNVTAGECRWLSSVIGEILLAYVEQNDAKKPTA